MFETIRNIDTFAPYRVEAITPEEIDAAVENGTIESALFSGGCFWGPDSFFGSLDGVIQTRVGYAGASTQNPSYDEFKGHAETVRVYYDPVLITYKELLQEFASRYFNTRTVGQYRTIFYPSDDQQRQEVEKIIDKLTNQNDPVPEVINLDSEKGRFWSAEDYHQKYRLRRNKRFLPFVEEELGERWDEHAFATKLNASSETDFDITPWVESFSDRAKSMFRVH